MTVKRKKRVLAIDDEPAMTEWLKILLEHEGYEVRTALIGTRGEEIFKTWRPDVVVTDMMLPDVDGIELLRKFKQTQPETEVIVDHRATGSDPKAVEAIKAGAFDFLEKPIEPDSLLDDAREGDRAQATCWARTCSSSRSCRTSSSSATSSARARRCRSCSSWSRAWRRATRTS